MRLRLAVLALIIVAGLIEAARTQDLPNLAGRWIPVGSSSQPPQPLMVSQTEMSITVQNWSKTGPSSGSYQWGLDSQRSAGEEPRAAWNGTTLVVTLPILVANVPNPSGVRTESWSLDRTGKLSVTIVLRRGQGPREVDTVLYSRAALD
jgi:hypothetical protein